MSNSRAGEPETVLRLDGITKRFGPLLANDGISISVRRGEIVGLLGENGAGKTTLMNILFGHYVADEGDVWAEGTMLPPGSPHAALAAGIGMVHQHFTLAENLTVFDNIVLGTEALWRPAQDRRKAQARIAELGRVFGLAVNANATISSLSVGERQRVEILKALYRKARILILDEPTAVLTPQESDALFATLKTFAAKGLAIIFISHKLNEVLAACHRVYVLRGGKLVAERQAGAVTRAELAELMVGRAIPLPRADHRQAGPDVFSMDHVSTDDAQPLRDISLTLRAGEIFGIAGVSGNGQTALAALCSGMLRPSAGRLALLGRTIERISPRLMIDSGVARIPEDRHTEGLIGDMSVTENAIAETCRKPPLLRHGLIDWTAARRLAEGIIARYDVKCPSPETPVRLLSGGNMQKLILGRTLDGDPLLIVASQPTRGLDVGAVSYVHERLLAERRRGVAILLISEDLDELLALSDRVAVIYRGQLSAPMNRSDVTIKDLGLRMAGAAHAA